MKEDTQLSFEDVLRGLEEGNLEVFVNSTWLDAYKKEHPLASPDDFVSYWLQSEKFLEAALDSEVLIIQQKGVADAVSADDAV